MSLSTVTTTNSAASTARSATAAKTKASTRRAAETRVKAKRVDKKLGLSKSRKLTASEAEAFGKEIEQIRKDVMDSVGPKEAAYIRRVQSFVRYSEFSARSLLMLGWLPPMWLAGTSLLSISKIVDNMELGHNVMHGQYDWINEPSLRGDTYEWDHACDGDAWRHYHNYLHHTYTNILGKDRDIGYGFMRLFAEQKWKPAHLTQPFFGLWLAFNFQLGVATHDLELEKLYSGEQSFQEFRKKLGPVVRKGLRQFAKDYVFFPLLAGPSLLPVLAGNASANLVRNLWTFSIIFCGHFTEHAETYPESVLETETRGEWYLRQIGGSSNLTGGPLFHFMTGNLSHQIEHHLYPDVPAVRYEEMGKKVREICDRYDQHYNTGSFRKQFTGVLKRVVRHALPS